MGKIKGKFGKIFLKMQKSLAKIEIEKMRIFLEDFWVFLLI